MWVRDRVSNKDGVQGKGMGKELSKRRVLEVNVIQPYFPQQEIKEGLGQSSSLLKCILAQEDQSW